MKPQRPYLLRALYDWIVDSGEIPYVLVDATMDEVSVPAEHIKDGQIVLNIGPSAVRDLSLGDDYVMCSGRFDGRVFELCLPMPSIKAIYSKDTAQGMVFPEETAGEGRSVGPAGDIANAPQSDAPSDNDKSNGADEAVASDAVPDGDTDKDKPSGPPNLRLV